MQSEYTTRTTEWATPVTAAVSWDHAKLEVAYCEFRSLTDTQPAAKRMPWPAFAQRLQRHVVLTAKRDGRLFSPTVYAAGTQRLAEHVEWVTLLVADIDHEGVPRDVLDAYEWVGYSTFRHTEDDPHVRLVLPLARPIPATEWLSTWLRVKTFLLPEMDEVCKDASRMYYWPAHPATRSVVWTEQHAGRLFDPLELPPVATPTPPPPSPSDPLPPDASAYVVTSRNGSSGVNGSVAANERLADWCARFVTDRVEALAHMPPDSGRHRATFRTAYVLGGLTPHLLAVEDAEQGLYAANARNGQVADPEEGEAKVRRTISDGLTRGAARPWTPAPQSARASPGSSDTQDDPAPTTAPTPADGWGADWPEMEDRRYVTLSPLGRVEYVENLLRPGHKVVVAAEEGVGKSYALDGELAIRLCGAAGAFAETWPIVKTGPVLFLSEMSSDDHFTREEKALNALGIARTDLTHACYRLPIFTAAGGTPCLMSAPWRTGIIQRLKDAGVLVMIFDTATSAISVNPWGQDIQAIYRSLDQMLATYPELCIVLVVHFTKPKGHAARRISDVIGEWGRFCDVVLMLEKDGDDHVKLWTEKRVEHHHHISATKRDGLLVNPRTLSTSGGPKVPLATVVTTIAIHPEGLTFQQLADALSASGTRVSKPTATTYAHAAVQAGKAIINTDAAPHRVFPTPS